MTSPYFRRPLIVGAVILGTLLLQFIAADNWGFGYLASDGGAWWYSCYFPLPGAAFSFMHWYVSPLLLQPSLFLLNLAWEEVLPTGKANPNPLAVSAVTLCMTHRFWFLCLIATVNTSFWVTLGLSLFRGLRRFRHPRNRSTEAPF